MVFFLVDTIEEILRDFYGRFVSSDVMSKAAKSLDLIKTSMLDTTIYKCFEEEGKKGQSLTQNC